MLVLRKKTPAVALMAPVVVSTTPFRCPASALPGDVVYLASADEVGLALAQDIGTMPCFGVVYKKLEATLCLVQYAGEAAFYEGLTPDTPYYVSHLRPGKLSATPPTTEMPGRVFQKVGTPRSSTTLLLSVDAMDYIVL